MQLLQGAYRFQSRWCSTGGGDMACDKVSYTESKNVTVQASASYISGKEKKNKY